MNLRELLELGPRQSKTFNALVIRQIGVSEVELHCSAESNQRRVFGIGSTAP